MTSTGGRRPETFWEHCLMWAVLLCRDEVLDEDDRPAVLVVTAAAIYTVGVDEGLATPQDGRQVRLAQVRAILRDQPYQALDATPSIPGTGGEEREALLSSAESTHPDMMLLWQRVRTAALSEVEASGAGLPNGGREDGPWWRREHTVEALVAYRSRQAAMSRMGAMEDYD